MMPDAASSGTSSHSHRTPLLLSYDQEGTPRDDWTGTANSVLNSDGSPEDKIQRLLRYGVEKLNVEYGYLSRINAGLGSQTIVERIGPAGMLEKEAEYDLEATYCRMAIIRSSPLSLHEASNQGWAEDRAYDQFGFESYLGQKVVANDQLYGTTCFTDTTPRGTSFTDEDHALLGQISQAIEHVLNPTSSSPETDRGLRRRVQKVSRVGGWELQLNPQQLSWTEDTYQLHEVSPDYDPDLTSAVGFYEEESQSLVHNQLNRCIEESTPYDEEVPLITAKGNRRWVRVRGVPHREHGEVTRITGTIREVSSPDIAENVPPFKNQFRKLVQNARSIIFMLDADGKVLMSEGRTLRLFGRNAGESVFDLFEEFPDVRSTIRNALDGTTINQTLDIEERTFNFKATPFYNDEGALAGCIGIATDITEKIEMQRALREERDLLNRVFETSPSAIAIINQEGNFVQVSDRAKEILGLEKEEVTNRTFNDPKWRITTLEGDPVPEEEIPFARVRDSRETIISAQHAIEWPDGTRRILSVSGAPLKNADGTFLGGVFHIDDITSRRKARLNLERSEQRFRGVFENAALGIALFNEEGQILEANPALESMLGYRGTEETLAGRNFRKVTYSADVEREKTLFREVSEGARDRYQIEKRYVRRNGDVFWGHLTVSRIDGTSEGQIVGMVENIDQRKRQQEELRLFRKAVEQAEEAALIFEADPRTEPGPSIVYANSAFASLSGYSTEEAIGETMSLLFGPDTESQVLQELWTALEDGRRHEGETVTYRADGTPFINRWSIAPVRDEEGTITHWVSVQRDVTEQRETGRRLLEIQAAERRRIDQEMHDQMGGLLTALQMTVDLARIEVRECGGPTAPIEKIEDRVSDLASVARTISRRMHPKVLSDDGLSEACTSLARNLEQRHDVQFEINTELGGDERLPYLVETTAYRVIQEVFVYAVRSTDAATVEARIQQDPDQLHLRMGSEASSFLSSSATGDLPQALQEIREWVERVDGEISVGSDEGIFWVEVNLPLMISSLPS